MVAGRWDRAYGTFPAETPLVSDLMDPTTINLLSKETLSILATFYGDDPVDLEAGILTVYASDCGGRPASDVSMSVPDTPEVGFVALNEGGPVEGSTTTTVAGLASLINVPAGSQRALVLRDEARDRVITDTLTFFVYGGSMHTIVYYPRNSPMQKWLAEAKRQGLLPE